MERFVVREVCGFGPGTILDLDKQQAAARSHLLRKTDQGRYLVLGRVEFKRGERIGVGGSLGKAQAAKLEVLPSLKKKDEKPHSPGARTHRGQRKDNVNSGKG